MDKCIKIFLNKQFSQKILDHIVPKKELFIVLPYVGMPSLCLRTCLQKSINSNILFCNTKSIFKSSTQLAHFFFFKDRIPLCLCSNNAYKFACGRCNATYSGETCRHFKVNVGEHSGIFNFNEQTVQIKRVNNCSGSYADVQPANFFWRF